MSKYASVADLKPELVMRGCMGTDEMDWLYGYSIWPNETSWGCPRYTISLWSGQSGTGKSRLAINTARNIARVAKVLYFQNEVDLNTFSGWIKDRENCKNFYCSNETSVIEQAKLIKELRPSLVFVDSVNEIEEFGSGAKGNIKHIMKYYRNVTLNKYCDHIILLGQLNQNQTIKGSTTLPHLVDIAFDLKQVEGDGSLFIMSIGVKHRYGRKGEKFISVWRHLENGVKCISDNRLDDEIWCNTHDILQRSEDVIFSSEELECMVRLERESPAIKPSAYDLASPESRAMTDEAREYIKAWDKNNNLTLEQFKKGKNVSPARPSIWRILLGQD